MECGPEWMRDEQCVQVMVACMHEFDSFFFFFSEASSFVPRTLQSAMPTSNELVAAFNSVHNAGEKKLTSILRDVCSLGISPAMHPFL